MWRNSAPAHLLLVGAFIRSKNHDGTFCSDAYLTDRNGPLSRSVLLTGVTVLITLGAVMLFVVMFGDYGACNEKRCALQVVSCFDG